MRRRYKRKSVEVGVFRSG